MANFSALIVASAVTHIHPGAGRAPGLVDLPVARDPLGYPYIRGTMVKGALKSAIARKISSVSYDSESEANVIKCNSKNHSVENTGGECPTCEELLCLLGGETGDGESGAAGISVQDLYPFLIPAPAFIAQGGSYNLSGIVYFTTKALLSKAIAYAEAAGHDKIIEVLKRLSEADGGNVLYVSGVSSGGGVATLSVSGLLIKARLEDGSSVKMIDSLLNMFRLNPLYKSYPVAERILVVGEEHGRILVERSIERVTRVALDRVTKTVRTGHLWTEEYLPWGTLFVGLTLDTGFRNAYCRNGGSAPSIEPVARIREAVAKCLGGGLVIGGNETVGAGLLRVEII